MRTKFSFVALLLVVACATPPEHHRHGGYGADGRMGAGSPNFQPAPHISRSPGTADADAILFASFDRDGDLLISAQELEAGLAREFARADANHDGAIDAAEYQAWSVRALGGAYAPYRLDVDRNADGRITMEEFVSAFRERARRYDSNGDGVIEHADLVHAAAVNNDDVQMLTPNDAPDSPQNGQAPQRRRNY